MIFVPYNLILHLFDNFLVVVLQPFIEVVFQGPCNTFLVYMAYFVPKKSCLCMQ